MDRQFEESNAHGKRPYELLCAGAGNADLGKRSGNLARRMKVNFKNTIGEVLFKASHGRFGWNLFEPDA
jgi:hypothetical protein